MGQFVLAGLLLLFSGSVCADLAKATFAGGCFWCMEPPYDELPGVVSTVSGYAGGDVKNPSYEEVSAGGTGHQEVVLVTYDDEKISYQDLLDVFWVNVDPLDASGQFCDKGSQYLSGIFYHNEEQQRLAEASKAKVQKGFDQPVVTFVKAVKNIAPAEEYHQNYYTKNSLRYNFYRSGCKRDERLKAVWGNNAMESL